MRVVTGGQITYWPMGRGINVGFNSEINRKCGDYLKPSRSNFGRMSKAKV